MAASVGGATARAMISRVAGGERVSLEELVSIADETARLMEYSNQLEQKSAELEETARQLRVANEKMRELDIQKDDFLSQISHELRTPMTSIRSFAELLSSDETISENDKITFTDIIYKDSIRLTGLLDEILDISVLENTQDLELNRVDPENALSRSIDTCRGLANSAHARIERFSNISDIEIYADQNRLTQVFINLISNAVKYNTSDFPIISIKSDIESGIYSVQIADNGPGILPEDATRVFEKFARGSAAMTQKGAGLGLAISRAIVQKFGGDLVLLPPDGNGARFEVTIPVA